MKVKAIAPWFGSKRTLADRIVAALGDHHTYFDPFCGSLAVLMAKPRVRMETVNDLHGDLINLARVIQSRSLGPVLYRRCRRMLMVEGLFREATERWKNRGVLPADETPNIERAIDFFFTSWVGRNGVVGTKSYNQGFAARYTPGGGHGGTRWQNAVGSIPDWRRRLESVTVLNRDGFALIRKIDDAPGVAIYCDPPYVVKGASYVYDFTEDQHATLAGLLCQFNRARVVVSYYDDPRIREMYRGWEVIECPVGKALVQGNGRVKGATVAPEILLINRGPVESQRPALFAGARS